MIVKNNFNVLLKFLFLQVYLQADKIDKKLNKPFIHLGPNCKDLKVIMFL